MQVFEDQGEVRRSFVLSDSDSDADVVRARSGRAGAWCSEVNDVKMLDIITQHRRAAQEPAELRTPARVVQRDVPEEVEAGRREPVPAYDAACSQRARVGVQEVEDVVS